MYKCTDCGEEFKEKPEYCNCGNNLFEEINTDKPALVQTPDPVNEPKPQSPTPKTKASKAPMNNLEMVSWIIFILCIVMSIFSIIFIGNTSPHTSKEKVQTNKSKPISEIKMPPIETLWQEPAPPVTVTPPTEPKVILPTEPKQIPAVVKTEPVTPPKVKQPEKKVTPKAVKPSLPKSSKNSDAEKLAFMNYKVALRNKIASDINFAAIVGDGKCIVSFNLDSSGRLTNRKFSKQSQNDSLNDVVYAAIMQNPSFKTPPNGYKNETLNLSVKMYDGNFEVNLY